MTPTPPTAEYARILAQNAYKGDTFVVKLKDDPTYYVGIPMVRSSLSRDQDETFTLKILEPREKSGMIERSIRDLELLQKK